jgi:DNA-binding LacI/PurR family transcriptional regulator
MERGAERNRRWTQRDIARIAGVSQATVSLVLNDAKTALGRIPEETRQRVQKAILETGYVADPIARRMAKGLNRILGVFTYEPAFPSAQADFFAPFLLGIESGAQQLGYDLLLLTGAANSNGKRKIFDENNRLRLADGCVILGREFDRAELKRLVSGDYPFVAVGRRDDAGGPVPYVGADYATATAALVRAARARGHSEFAYVGPATGPEATRDCWRGLQAGLREGARLSLHVPEAGGPAPDLLAAVQASAATAVFFTELADAIPFRRSAIASGLTVPGDLSIIVLGSHVRPTDTGTRFTTYDIPREEMGRRATEMLIGSIEQTGEVLQVLLSCEPIEGETLGPISKGKNI